MLFCYWLLPTTTPSLPRPAPGDGTGDLAPPIPSLPPRPRPGDEGGASGPGRAARSPVPVEPAGELVCEGF